MEDWICHYSIILAQSRKANTTMESFYLATEGKILRYFSYRQTVRIQDIYTNVEGLCLKEHYGSYLEEPSSPRKKKDLCLRSKETSFKSFPRGEGE